MARRAEVSDLGRLNRLLREEMDMIKEEHMAVTVQVGEAGVAWDEQAECTPG